MTTNSHQPKKLSQLYPPRFLSATELAAPAHITIALAQFEDVRDQSGDTIQKPVIYAAGAKRGIVLNKTNTKQLIELFGDIDFPQLAGKRLTVYPCPHPKNHKLMLCFKAAPPRPAPTSAPAETASTTQQDKPQP